MVTELEPGMLVGRYRLVEEIAHGGMGSVWVARDERLEREVAIKVLPRLLLADPSAEQRFEREARAMGRLQHPNVVTLFDVGSADPGTGEEVPFLVMERVRGTSLDRLMADGPVPPGRVVRIFEQVAMALAVAHEAGVIHRDLKPSNIMVGDGEHVSVLDFGLARLAKQEGGIQEDTLTTPGMVLGSCPYMAPEQALGQRVGPASDVFSCGTVMYEALTGERAFDGSTPMRVLQAVVRCEYVPLAEAAPEVPEELARVVERCLAKDLDDRFASAAELLGELEALDPCMAVDATEAPAVDQRPDTASSETRVAPARALAGAAVGLALVAGLVVGFVVGRLVPLGVVADAGSNPDPVVGVEEPNAGARPAALGSIIRPIGDPSGYRIFPVSDDRMVAVVGSALPTGVNESLDALVGAGIAGREIISQLNTALIDLQGDAQVELAIVDVDLGRHHVTVTSAGFVAGLVVQADGRLTTWSARAPPLGDPGFVAAVEELSYPPGSHLVLLTRCRPAAADGESECGLGTIADVLRGRRNLEAYEVEEVVAGHLERLGAAENRGFAPRVLVLSHP